MDSGNAQPFGQLLKQRRKNLDLTQDQLAERVGCSSATIRLIELGLRRPSRQIAVLLAQSLRIPASEQADFLALARGVSLTNVATEDTSETTALESESPISSNLPAQLITLFGRDEEVASLVSLMSRGEVQLLTLTGPPGVGKTSLALQVASSLLQHPFATDGVVPPFSDGTFWVALAAITKPEMVVPAIARVLEVQELGSQALFTTLKQHLTHKRMLLLLDNFEQVIEAAPQMAEILSSCPHLKLLVTSREPLHIRREQEYNVEPLALPTSVSLGESPAVALFVERAQAVDMRFAFNEESAQIVAAICAKLDGLPLAIELVAARTKILPLKALLARLQAAEGQSSHLDLLAGGARDLPDRHRTLRDAISWSYSLLTQDEQVLFRRVGVFLGGFTLPAAEAVCNANSDLRLELFEVISQLLHKNLLKREIKHEEANAGDSRYLMLETIREYSLELMRAHGEEDGLKLLHTEYFLSMSSSPDLGAIGESERALYNQLDRDNDNLRVALIWTIEHGRLDLAAQFGISLSRYWEVRGNYTEGRDLLFRILAAQKAAVRLEPLAPGKQSKLLYYAGRLSLFLSDYPQARHLLEESLLLAREAEDHPWATRVNNQLALVAWFGGDYSVAESLFETALRNVQETGNKQSIAGLLWTLGMVVGECGDFQRAEILLKEANSLAREVGDEYTTIGSTRDLGTTLCYAGKYPEARQLLEEALSAARTGGFEVGTSWTLSTLGLTMIGLGDYDRAESYFRESLGLARRIEKHRVADCLEGLAEIELVRAWPGNEQKHTERAATFLGAAVRVRSILNSAILPVRKPVRERLISQAQGLLDASVYEQAYATGQSMTLSEAISFGLDL